MARNLLVSISFLVASSCNGFGVVPVARSFVVGPIPSQQHPPHEQQQSRQNRRIIIETSALWMMDSESSSSSNQEAEAPPVAEEASCAAEEEEQVVELTNTEEEKPATQKGEDPALQKLKEEIASLEKTLKDKRRYLASTQDRADDFTKTGYARKVAEMENMRRARKMLQNSNAAGAMASTLAEFLPVYDRLQELSDAYSEDDFGKQYNALLSSMGQAFTDLGVTPYATVVGEPVNASRMIVLESMSSAEQPVDTVLEVRQPGWELKGNVVRFAQVIASLGPAEAAAETTAEGESAE